MNSRRSHTPSVVDFCTDISEILSRGGEGGSGEGVRESQEGGDICRHMADSCCCKQNLTSQCKAITFQLKIIF